MVIVAVKLLEKSTSMTKIIEASAQNEKKVMNSYSAIKDYFDLPERRIVPPEVKLEKELQSVREYCRELKISKEITQMAENLFCKIVREYWLNGQSNTKIAVAIWVSLQNASTLRSVTLKDVSDVVGPAVNTIRNNAKIVSEKVVLDKTSVVSWPNSPCLSSCSCSCSCNCTSF